MLPSISIDDDRFDGHDVFTALQEVWLCFNANGALMTLQEVRHVQGQGILAEQAQLAGQEQLAGQSLLAGQRRWQGSGYWRDRSSW